MNLQSCFQEFLNHLLAEKNVSDQTITSYKTDFKIFVEFLNLMDIETSLGKITTPILRKYISYIKIHRKYKTNTIRRKVHSLSSFYKFLLEQEYIEKNPMLPIHAPQEEKNLLVYIKENELKRLLEAPDKYARFLEHRLRDTVMLELLVFTGGRRSEILALDFDDIDFKAKTITILKGKGKKQRIVPLLEPLATHLWKYLQSRLPLANRAILVSDLGSRMSTSNFQVLFKRYLNKSGLGKKGYTIHKCRHSFASLLHQNGVDLISIKELLGHEDLNSTKIYTHTSVNHLRKEAEKFPLSL